VLNLLFFCKYNITLLVSFLGMHSAYNSGGSSEKERHFRGFDNSSNGVNADGVASLYYREERAVLWSNA